MNEATSKSFRHITIAVIIVVGVTLNTILLRGAGSSSDGIIVQERLDLYKSQYEEHTRRNLEYLEERISKAERRHDEYFNSLNRRMDIVENKTDRVVNKASVTTTVNNTFTPISVVSNNNNKKD